VFEPVVDGSTQGGSLNRSKGLMSQANQARLAGPNTPAQKTSTSTFDPLHRGHTLSTDQVSAPVIQQGSLPVFAMDQNVVAVPTTGSTVADGSDLMGFHTPPMIQMSRSGSMMAENNHQAPSTQSLESIHRVQPPHMSFVPQNQLAGMDFQQTQTMTIQQPAIQFQGNANADSNASWQGGNQWNQIQQPQAQQQAVMNPTMASGIPPHQTQHGQIDASQWNQQQQQQQHHAALNAMASGMPAPQTSQWNQQQQQQPQHTAMNTMVNVMAAAPGHANDASQWNQQQPQQTSNPLVNVSDTNKWSQQQHQPQQTAMQLIVQNDTIQWNQQQLQQPNDASQWNQQQVLHPQQTSMNHMASGLSTLQCQNDTNQWNQQQQQQPQPTGFDPLHHAPSDRFTQQQAEMNPQRQQQLAPNETAQWHQQQHENANTMQQTLPGNVGGFDPMQHASTEPSKAHSRSNSMENSQGSCASPDPFDQLVRRPPSGSQQLGR
jgi:hypothetical protein